MSVDTTLHSLLHTRFQEVFGPPHHDLYDSEQWSLSPATGKGTINVLLNGTRRGPLVWVFNPQDATNTAQHFAVTHEKQIDELIEHLKDSVRGVPHHPESPEGRRMLLEDVVTTKELARRPSRSSDFAAENNALIALAQGMARNPQTILQLTVETAMQLCCAASSGISILESEGENEVFRWVATAGALASQVGETMPRESPCGTVVDRNAVLMFQRPELHFRFPGLVDPPIEEVILAPFQCSGRPTGTLWVMLHDKNRQFDREDARLLASVAQFAGAAYQMTSALNAAQADRAEMTSARDALILHTNELEEIVAERTKELVETHQQLRLAERMATMGTLSAGLGHDMGNMVFAMRTRLDALRQSAEAAADHAQVVGDCVTYLHNLASGLRLMAIDPAGKGLGPERITLATWWLAAHRVFTIGTTSGIAIKSNVSDELPDVLINRAGLTQAVFNLVQNAVDAMQGHRGTITIAAEKDAKGQVLLSVSDEGPGMSDEILHRCMDPFFSTKIGSTSSGLGLALVHSVMKAAGGAVRIETKPGRGTKFILALPAAP